MDRSDRNYSESIRYAKEIRDRSKILGISLSYLEKEAGYSQGYLARCAKGSRALTIDGVKVFSKLLGINFFEVLK